jgi:hypothetical protein
MMMIIAQAEAEQKTVEDATVEAEAIAQVAA